MPKYIIRKIEKQNQMDIEIYEYAKSGFKRLCVDKGNSFKGKIDAYKLRNWMYQFVMGKTETMLMPFSYLKRNLVQRT